MTQVAVGGTILHYQEVGNGKGVPLLILHGWGRSGNEWIEMARKLSSWSGGKAYILDLPGFGGSSLPKVKNIQEYARLVVDFCQYLHLEKVVVIGHSLGGRVGIIMAAQFLTLVEKLILVDPAGVKPRSLKRILLQILAFLFRWIPVTIRRNIVKPLMDADYQDSPNLQALYRVVVGENLRSYLRDIACPVQIIWGERDPILPLGLTKIYRRHLRDVSVRVVWGAGHDPHLSHLAQTQILLEEMVV